MATALAPTLPGDTGGNMPPPAAAPPPADNSAISALTANDATTQRLLAQQQREMAPAISSAQGILAQPAPQAPAFQPEPKVPDQRAQLVQNANDFLQTAALVAGIAGALSKQHVTTMLNAFGSALKGMHEGQISSAAQADDVFKNSLAQTKAVNDGKQQAYTNVMNNRKLSIDDQMSQIQLIAAKYHDELMYQASSAKNFMMVANLMERQAEATARLQMTGDKIQSQWEQFKLGFEAKYGDVKTYQERVTAAANVYAKLFPADATGRRVTVNAKGQVTLAPPFDQWFQTEYPKLAPMLSSTGAVPGRESAGELDAKAQTAIDAGISRDDVRKAYVQDGGSAADFDKKFPSQGLNPPGAGTMRPADPVAPAGIP